MLTLNNIRSISPYMNQCEVGIRHDGMAGQVLRLGCLISLLGLMTASAALPNLAPYQESGWSDKIVVSWTTGAL